VKKKSPIKHVTEPQVQSMQVPNPKLKIYMGLVCAILAFLLYSNTLNHDYTVDDGTVMANNEITKRGISALPEIFSTSYRAGFWERNEGLYRPLSVAMFAVEWELSPEKASLGHWINVILYALTAYLLFITLSAFLANYSILFPLTVTLLFVVHPIHTEVVANIKSRDEILCFLFLVITLQQLYNYCTKGKLLSLVAAAAAYFLAFLSKENAVTILAVIPITIWFFTGKNISLNIKTSLVFLGVAVLYILIRYSVLGSLTGSAEMQLINNSILGAESFDARLATAILIMGKYLLLLFIPHPLVFDYSYNQIPLASFGEPGVLISLLIYAYLVYYAIKGIKTKNPAAFGILYFFITISLVSNLLMLIESTMAERFLYIPSLGFCIAIVYVLMKVFKILNPKNSGDIKSILRSKPLFAIILTVIFLAYSIKTISRNSDWKNNLTLLEQDVKNSPNSARIRYAYGSALLIEKALKEENESIKQGLLDKSIGQLERGVAILPTYAEAWYHLGIAYKEKNNAPLAIAAFDKAREYKTFKEADFYISSGLAYGLGKQYQKAIADFTKALEIDAENPETYNNKGLYFTEAGVLDSAHIYLDEAIGRKPDFYQAVYNKGNAFAKTGDFKSAIAQYIKAIELKPDYTDALLNLGNSYAALNDYKNALYYFTKVEEQEPGNSKVLYNIGITYRILGDQVNADKYFEKSRQAGGIAK
jgi:protein O-mannosyl-transferase